jgi:hypothetical protein
VKTFRGGLAIRNRQFEGSVSVERCEMANDRAGTKVRAEFEPHKKIIAALRGLRTFDDYVWKVACRLSGL